MDHVNTDLISLLLVHGYLPVVSPPGISVEGVAINVDGDRAAAALAVALGAEALLLLSNVPGLLSAFPDEDTLIPHIAAERIESYLDVAQGRMKKKGVGCRRSYNRRGSSGSLW